MTVRLYNLGSDFGGELLSYPISRRLPAENRFVEGVTLVG